MFWIFSNTYIYRHLLDAVLSVSKVDEINCVSKIILENNETLAISCVYLEPCNHMYKYKKPHYSNVRLENINFLMLSCSSQMTNKISICLKGRY